MLCLSSLLASAAAFSNHGTPLQQLRPRACATSDTGQQPRLVARPLLLIRGGQMQMSLAQAFSVYAPAMGVLTSNALYFSALPAVLEARKTGNLGPFNPLPSTIMVLSVFAWLCYGLTVSNPWIVASNLPGAAAVLATFVTLLPLMGRDHKALAACQSTFVGGAMATLGLWTFAVFGGVSAALRAKLIGYFASAIFVVLAASPLSTIRTVLAERNSASIYAPLTAAQCANTLLQP